MNDEQSFVQAMQVHPEDAHLRLIFADWLEERGDSRGELIRLLHTLTQSVEVPERGKVEERLRSLLASGVQPVGPFLTNSLGMKFAWVPAGMFMMGSPETEEGRDADETRHRVTLSKGLYVGVHAVKQVSWLAVMGNNPSCHQGDELPVEQVSWYDCQEFLGKLSELEGRAYRLPTEAEWEYACRAGTSTPFYFGETITTEQANFDGNYPCGKEEKGVCRGKTTAVGSFPANGFGLHDMHGNTFDWCSDWYSDVNPPGDVVDPPGPPEGERRVFRGGSFDFAATDVRSAFRRRYMPKNRDIIVGVRAATSFTA